MTAWWSRIDSGLLPRIVQLIRRPLRTCHFEINLVRREQTASFGRVSYTDPIECEYPYHYGSRKW
jgi:hypothetical protein